MIGGADIVLQGRTNVHDAGLLVQGIRCEWPDALIQRADDEGEAVSARTFHPSIIGTVELIVYRDEASYQSWKSDGATADNQDGMIQIIVSDDSVTIVVDRAGSALAHLAQKLLEPLKRNRAAASASEQLADNREHGALFEQLVGEALVEAFPDAEILPQVSAFTSDGKESLVDFAIKNRNGSVTVVEVKNVPELLEKHVQQAEDHRAGLKYLEVHAQQAEDHRTDPKYSVLPIVVVSAHTLVSKELASRVHLMRLSIHLSV